MKQVKTVRYFSNKYKHLLMTFSDVYSVFSPRRYIDAPKRQTTLGIIVLIAKSSK